VLAEPVVLVEGVAADTTDAGTWPAGQVQLESFVTAALATASSDRGFFDFCVMSRWRSQDAQHA